jgi:diacylglycerol kinase family enzyme
MSESTAPRVHEDLTPAPRARAGRTAVLLNANAKRVTERVRREVAQVAPDADIFYTQSLEEADFVHRRVADLGYDFVYTGGGDGTVVHTIDQVCRRLDDNGFPYPRFGVLKLGTGNGIADFFGAGDFRDDLKRGPEAATRDLHLMSVEGVRAPFFGFGWDAYILNNYDLLKRQAQRFAWSRALFKTALGYLIAGVGKSVPEFIVKRPSWNIRVVNTGGVGYQLDRQGNAIERYAPGALVYEGTCRLGCFGTTPFYGFKFRMLPFADKTPGMFHFRVIDMPPLAAVAQLPRAWVGRLDHPRLFDFQLTGCEVEFSHDAPFQIGGDAKGTRPGLKVAMHPRAIPCIAFGR